MVELELDLLETTCHKVNPKHWNDCETHGESEREVTAKCLVKMTVKSGEPQVTKYDCDTKLVKTDTEMVMTCPHCPMLVPLNTNEGLKSVHEAVKKANQDHSHQHYYVLHDVGRITTGYMFAAGIAYYAEFALVESHCPAASRIVPEACKPLCPDRAGHAFCDSSYTTINGLGHVQCEFYPALNTYSLRDGVQEPDCLALHSPPHSRVSPSPPHGRVGPPFPASHGNVGPPSPIPGGPPLHSGPSGPLPPGHEMPHYMPPYPCHGALKNFNPALHPICPWPLPEPIIS